MYPILEIDYIFYPNLAENIWQAQQAGHPNILTYGANKKMNRKGAMHYEVDYLRYEIVQIESRDEYPFACCLEGGETSWVGHIPPRENAAQGGLIASFLKRHAILPNQGEKSKFIVKVINRIK
ncbi:MAG TPA: NucA/NucB deoxyribonuclease domain-containing protein [Bacteroidia bacterium]|nr:NucA/NucB deoxyribonuclease domain-containing protein [Bacteroidia bacterium]